MIKGYNVILLQAVRSSRVVTHFITIAHILHNYYTIIIAVGFPQQTMIIKLINPHCISNPLTSCTNLVASLMQHKKTFYCCCSQRLLSTSSTLLPQKYHLSNSQAHW